MKNRYMKQKMLSMILSVVLIFSLMVRPVLAVSVTNETAANWIDRVDDDPKVKSIYNLLVEATDNDGLDDYLIDDEYFVDDGEYHGVKSVGRAGIVYSKEALDQKINQASAELGEAAQAAMDAFDRDHPEVFWLSGERMYDIQASCSEDGRGSYFYDVKIRILMKGPDFDARSENYRSAEAIRAAISERDLLVEEILAGTEQMEPYEKVVYFNEILTKANEYNTTADLSTINNDCYESISALRGSIGSEGPVCEGYARAFKVLCDRAGIPCVLVDGLGTDGYVSEGHMWNAVLMETAWYGVDVTWNDPVGGAAGAVSGYENEDWLMVGSETVINGMAFSESHQISNQASYGGLNFGTGPELSKMAFEPKGPLGDEVIGCESWTLVETAYSNQMQHVNGALTEAENWLTSEFIAVAEGERYRYVGQCEKTIEIHGMGLICAFDEEYRLVMCILREGEYLEGYEFRIPEGVSYIRCCYRLDGVTIYGLQYLESHTHLWETVVIDPTCTEQGYTERTCGKCGDIHIDEYVEPNGHNFVGDWITVRQEDCDSDGEYVKYCTDCDQSIRDFRPVIGHDYTDWYVTKEATEEEKGEKCRDCEVCGHVDVMEIPIVKWVVSHEVLSAPEKKYYLPGEPLELNGLVTLLIYSDGSQKYGRLEKMVVTGYDPNKIGKQQVDVTYRDMTASFEVMVSYRGDANCDGTITVTDLLVLKALLLGKSGQTLIKAYADVNGDGSLTMTDFLQVKAHLLGKNQLIPE